MTTIEHSYRVAGFWLSVYLPETWDADTLLPSFRPFLQERPAADGALLDCVVRPRPDVQRADSLGTVIEETCNDMGYIRLYERQGGYSVALSDDPAGLLHFMQAGKDFSDIQIYLCPDDKDAGRMLSSMLRVAYSQAILYHDALAIHASAVHYDKHAYLFLGRSGTGKSTHSSLWMAHIPGTGLLNDDNPTVRIIKGTAYAYGTPWSGKTPCYKDCFYPIGGMVRLRQASENRFCRQEGADAFVTLFPGCSAICRDEELRLRLYDTVSRLAEIVPTAVLDCRPDKDAALLCCRALQEADE